jgi:O-antigen/teichoic acid export membrane protein
MPPEEAGPGNERTAGTGGRGAFLRALWRRGAEASGRRGVRQAGIWTGATVLAGLLGLLTQTLLADHLSVADFAAFGFSLAFLQFAALFFEFGLFVPASRLAARTAGLERRRLAGSALLAYVPVGLLFGLVVFAASFVVDDIFKVDASDTLRAAALLSFGFPFVFIGQQLAQGADRLYAASAGALVAQLVGFGGVALALWIGSGIGPVAAVEIRAAGLLLAGVLVAVLLRPRFVRPAEEVRAFARGAREYGLAIYAGRVLSVGTFNVDVLLIAALTDVRTIAVYTLARALATFTSVPADGIAAAVFPRMARREGIPARDLRTVVAVSAAAVLGVVAAGAALAAFAFSSAYSELPLYVAILSIAYAIRGVAALYSGYLSARGLGDALRRAGFALTAANVVLNFTLIPAFGGIGAAVAGVLALAINLAMLVRGYRASLSRPLA